MPSGRWGRITGFLLQDVGGEGSKVASAFINRGFLKFHKLCRSSNRKSPWTPERALQGARPSEAASASPPRGREGLPACEQSRRRRPRGQRLQGPKSAAPGVLAHRGSARGQRGGGESRPGPSRLPPERCAAALQRDRRGPVFQGAAASLLAHPEPAGPQMPSRPSRGQRGSVGGGRRKGPSGRGGGFSQERCLSRNWEGEGLRGAGGRGEEGCGQRGPRRP